MRYLYVKKDGETKRYNNDSEEKISKVLQNKNYTILNFIPKEDKNGFVDFISNDFNISLDYMTRNHYNTHIKKDKDVYDSVLTSLMSVILNIKNVDDVINLDREDSFARAICKFYTTLYESNASEQYIKHIYDNHQQVEQEELLLAYGKIMKQVVRRYVTDHIKTLTPNQLTEINKNTDRVFEFIYVKDKNINNITDDCLKEFIETIGKYVVRDLTSSRASNETLCSHCPLDLSMGCPRVMDDPPKHIYQYKFITAGRESTETKEIYYTKDEEGYPKRIDKYEVKNYAEDEVEVKTIETTTTYKVLKCTKYYKRIEESKQRFNRNNNI